MILLTSLENDFGINDLLDKILFRREAEKSLPGFGTCPPRAATEGGPYECRVGAALRGGPACPLRVVFLHLPLALNFKLQTLNHPKDDP
jgi:hypothetical protein